MNIGDKIKNARIAKGMTQEELGQILGVQKSAIAKYEKGRVVNIKRSTLKKISDALNIPPFELIYEGEVKEAQKKGGTIADAALRMKNDSEFLSIVETLLPLDSKKLEDVKQMLSIFLK